MLLQRLLQYSALIQKIAIAFCLAWVVLMMVIFWMSGAKETAHALKSGKRFIITVADGTVTGHQTDTGEIKADAVVEVPAAAEEQMDESIVKAAAPNTASTVIAEVNPDLVEKMGSISLPRTANSGLKPMQYYMKPFRRLDETPVVAIVVTGLGLSRQVTEMALALDDRIGLSFSPYAPLIGSWAVASRLSGHEMFIDLPMQSVTYPANDPGPYSLLLGRSDTANVKYLQWAMSRFQGYTGMVAPMNEVITANPETFMPIADELAKRGIMLVTPRSRTGQMPEPEKKKNMPVSVFADVWLDEELSEVSIQARLATLAQTAQRSGFAVGVAQAYPITLKQIADWQKIMGEHGVALVPVSFISKLKN